MWDLDCLDAVVSDIKETEKNSPLSEKLYLKIKNAMDFIENHRISKKQK
jgi:hypothetical protein